MWANFYRIELFQKIYKIIRHVSMNVIANLCISKLSSWSNITSQMTSRIATWITRRSLYVNLYMYTILLLLLLSIWYDYSNIQSVNNDTLSTCIQVPQIIFTMIMHLKVCLCVIQGINIFCVTLMFDYVCFSQEFKSTKFIVTLYCHISTW